VDLLVHLLRLTIVSEWIRFWFEPKWHEKPSVATRWWRDRVVEFYIVAELALLVGLLCVPEHISVVACWIAVYVMYCLYVNLFNIVFVGKLIDIQPPTLSIERSLLLFVINAAQIVTAFAILYRFHFQFGPGPALFYSLLVFGTIGHPVDTNSPTGLFTGAFVVGAQIALNFVFIAIFLSAFVGRLKAFDRMQTTETRDSGLDERTRERRSK
jgi:hypothetical protein